MVFPRLNAPTAAVENQESDQIALLGNRVIGEQGSSEEDEIVEVADVEELLDFVIEDVEAAERTIPISEDDEQVKEKLEDSGEE